MTARRGRAVHEDSATPLLRLQRTAGNRATTALVEAGRRAAHSDGTGEAGAERLADAVEPLPRTPPAQLRSAPSAWPVDTATEAAIRRARSAGRPLPDAVQEALGGVLGDLSVVRVHDDAASHRISSQLRARAFTAGRDVFFGRGHFDPQSQQGRHLLAHEIGHVVQQADRPRTPVAVQRNPDPCPKCSAENPPHAPSCSKCGTPLKFTYSQSTDPSVTPFLKGGETFMGQSGMEKQKKRKAPMSSDIRVSAQKTTSYQRAGSGMHEGLPTDQRSRIATSGMGGESGTQSGLRSGTDLSLLATPEGESTGHTGFFPKPKGRGSTNTSGQKRSHDILREVPTTGSTPEEVMVQSSGRFLEGMSTGPQVMQSDTITGGVPNVTNVGPVEPVTTSDSSPGEVRLALAQQQHERRERAKKRLTTVAESEGLETPASPERDPIDETGEGGGYMDLTGTPRPSSPLPFSFEGSGEELIANKTSWISAPFRHKSESVTWDKVCPTCGAKNAKDVGWCQTCFTKL